MPKLVRSALLPFPAQAIYDLVNDIAAYPTFLPWCTQASVLKQGDGFVEAVLVITKGAVRHTLKTRNWINPNTSIAINLLEGPFTTFSGLWTFTPLGAEGSKVTLTINLELPRLLQVTVGTLVNQATQRIMDAFCQRAEYLYG